MTYTEWLEDLRVVRANKRDTRDHHDNHKGLLDKERELIRYYNENQDKFLQEQLDKGE